MVFSHNGLEVGGSDVVWARLIGTPLHEQTVGDAAKHSQDPERVIILYPRTVIIVGNVQTLVQTAFDPPALSVKLQPKLGWKHGGRSAGDQGDLFILTSLGLAQQSRYLAGESEAHVFGANGGAANNPTLPSTFIDLERAGLGRGGMLRGKNPPEERLLSVRWWSEASVDCL